jgi:hypothetical protein
MPVSISGNGTFAGLTSVETVDLRHPDAVAANITLGADGSVPLDAANIASGTVDTARLPALGKVLQVVQTTKTDVFSTTSSSFTNITGLSVTVTPSSTSSKIMLIAQVGHGPGEGNGGQFQFSGGNAGTYIGNASGSRTRAIAGGSMPSTSSVRISVLAQTFIYLDSPNTTSATTYNLQTRAAGGTVFINRVMSDGNDAARTMGASSITAIEVAA